MTYMLFSTAKENNRNLGGTHRFASLFGLIFYQCEKQPPVSLAHSYVDFFCQTLQSRWFDSSMISAKTFFNKIFLPFGVRRIIQCFLLVFIFKLWIAFWFNLCQTMLIWYETILCSLVVCSAWASQLSLQILIFQNLFLIAKCNYLR